MRFPLAMAVTALAVSMLSASVFADVPDTIEVICDVDRKAFRKLIKTVDKVTFELHNIETGPDPCASYPIDIDDLTVFSSKTDSVKHLDDLGNVEAGKPRKFDQIRVVLSPVTLCSGENWMQLNVAGEELSCDFSLEGKTCLLGDNPGDACTKESQCPNGRCGTRRQLKSVPFAWKAGTAGEVECDGCVCTQEIGDGCITADKLAPDAPKDISVRVFNSTNVSIPHEGSPALTFDSERWDTDNIHDESASADCTNLDPMVPNRCRLTANTAGKYLIFGHVVFATNNGVGVRQLHIKRNGIDNFLASIVVDGVEGTEALPGPAGPGGHHMSIATHYALAKNDYVTLHVYQNSGAALNVITSINLSPEFGMVKLP